MTEFPPKTPLVQDEDAQQPEAAVEEPSLEKSAEERERDILHEYWQNRATKEAALAALRRKRLEAGKLARVHASLGMESNTPISEPESDQLETAETELIAAEANYPGHWTLLLEDRLRDPETKRKFVQVRTEALPSLRQGEPGQFDKEKQFQSHYEAQIADYDKNIDSVFNTTNIGNASEFGRPPLHAGMGNIGEPGTVFLDAETREGVPLTTRQKMIIEAHEKGHGMRDFQGSDADEIRSTLDFNVLAERESLTTAENPQNRFVNYLRDASEIVERMAQLKNYFGFKGDEEFTRLHLEFAKKHYIQDTGLDNTMSHFFAAITPETENQFLAVMNKYPI
ncbi:MAG: hypothetical protein V4480_00280 [Patescibacteria group bacterium]